MAPARLFWTGALCRRIRHPQARATMQQSERISLHPEDRPSASTPYSSPGFWQGRPTEPHALSISAHQFPFMKTPFYLYPHSSYVLRIGLPGLSLPSSRVTPIASHYRSFACLRHSHAPFTLLCPPCFHPSAPLRPVPHPLTP